MKRPEVDNIAVNETRDVIKHGDEIHIVHGMTGRLLNSHDVAAPVTPQNQVSPTSPLLFQYEAYKR